MESAFAFFISFFVSAPLEGWGLSLIWGWFVVPLGAPPIGIAHAIGLTCIVSLIAVNFQRLTANPDSEVSPLAAVFIRIVLRLFVIGIAYAVAQFMP